MAVAAAVLTAELLHFQVQSHRATQVLNAMQQAATKANVKARRTDRFDGASQVLLLWGPGAPDRVEPMRRQVANGGHAVVFDLSYWQRDHKFRVSIDAPHPQARVMAHARTPARFDADPVPVANLWKPDGPVVIAGIGEKATVQYGSDVGTWEGEMIARAKAAGREVIYRPKKTDGRAPSGVTVASHGKIDSVLRGASAVVTWHSNVAVDAIRLGIPAICRDGAAAAVCGREWAPDLRPLDDAARRQFLANLAWFQWSPNEARQCWHWLIEVLA